MKPNLLDKFFISYVAVVLASFVLLFTFSSSSIERYLMDRSKELLENESDFILDIYKTTLSNEGGNYNDFVTQLVSIDDFLNVEVWFVDVRGTILFTSNDEHTALVYQKNIADFNQNILNESLRMMKGNFYGFFDVDTLSLFREISIDYRTQGYIVLHTPLTDIATTQSYISQIGLTTFFFTSLITFVILYIYANEIIRPLNLMNKAAKEYADGNFDYHLNIYSADEIGQLAGSLNNMAYELHKIDEFRNAFIANISHDFRSPLTSIKGYIEAMLDGTIPSDSQEKYLNIVLFEAERLNKLTANLLTLNNYDTTGLVLDFRNFDINSLLKHILLTFERTCANKKIKFKLVTSDKFVWVNADPDKIQQVLYNLIDNAIKFCRPNSTITIETKLIKGHKVEVSIKDTGIGIPVESLKHIWERFYKSDLSRGQDKQGTGLGLSIVKDIIKAHGEEISVSSKENQFTEFRFTLQQPKK